MAISKFVTANTYDLTAFYNWLQAKKAGTFLENMTISLSNATATGSTLTIASENATFTFNPKQGTQAWTVISLAGESGTWTNVTSATGYSGDGTFFGGALLCTNGIILRTSSLNNTTYTDNYFVITADSSGEVAFVRRNANANQGANANGYIGIAYKSTAQKTTTLTPTYGSPLTSIAPIVPQTSENDITFPYAFAALHTQQSGLGLAAVSIGTDKYITNGYWYVKD